MTREYRGSWKFEKETKLNCIINGQSLKVFIINYEWYTIFKARRRRKKRYTHEDKLSLPTNKKFTRGVFVLNLFILCTNKNADIFHFYISDLLNL